jgi:hypothetical protein
MKWCSSSKGFWKKKFYPKLAFIDKATLHAQVHDSFIKSKEIGCLFHGFEQIVYVVFFYWMCDVCSKEMCDDDLCITCLFW